MHKKQNIYIYIWNRDVFLNPFEFFRSFEKNHVFLMLS
jgi:hypothetical protein